MRFTWDLTRLPDVRSDLGAHFNFRSAREDEQEIVWTVAQRSFSLDSDWSDTFKTFHDYARVQIEDAFKEEHNHCLVLTHGQRIIGISALCVRKETDNHLLSGPCILIEYRNRGLGSALLYKSLVALREGGLEQAHGITKRGGPAAKFVYAKFDAEAAPFDLDPRLAIAPGG